MVQEPPNEGGGSPNNGVSFKDKLLGAKQSLPSRKKVDLLQEKKAQLEFLGGDRLYPIVCFEKEVLERICVPWKDALVVKLLGKNIGFLAMRDRLKKLWKSIGIFDIIDLDYGFFLIKFDEDEDRFHVMEGGPWMLFDHYLSVRTWSMDFVASSAKVEKTLVWIRFPCLNMAYYDEEVLFTLAHAIGEPVKIDLITLEVSRGKFA